MTPWAFARRPEWCCRQASCGRSTELFWVQNACPCTCRWTNRHWLGGFCANYLNGWTTLAMRCCPITWEKIATAYAPITWRNNSPTCSTVTKITDPIGSTNGHKALTNGNAPRHYLPHMRGKPPCGETCCKMCNNTPHGLGILNRALMCTRHFSTH